jgi:pyridinium-3,5-bisthiocarboxylic acid mononucleotide nickel chelatase
MQIHLDTPGGMAGDMFVAALLDAFPEHEAGVLGSVAAAAGPVTVRSRLVRHHDGVLSGHRFLVEPADASAIAYQPYEQHHHHGDAAGGPHLDSHTQAAVAHQHSSEAHENSWARIRVQLERAVLDSRVREHARSIFSHLAEAEAQVHGIAVERVAFHEVGAWDSIADIVAAAHLIAALDASVWTVGPLPLGSGFVATAHGRLPVPAPATALLLRGFAMVDDGVGGERVTPTGAAILRHLCGHSQSAPRAPRILGRSGVGFGSRALPGIPNCVRVLAFDEAADNRTPAHRELSVIEFEVDDQSPEDLAAGLERLRAEPGIFDVVQMPAFGKKGRMTTHVRALVRVDRLEDAIIACFKETTTIGLRHHIVGGTVLPRRSTTIDVDGWPVRVKTVDRPDGRTAKAESDDALGRKGHAARLELKRRAERLALEGEEA